MFNYVYITQDLQTNFACQNDITMGGGGGGGGVAGYSASFRCLGHRFCTSLVTRRHTLRHRKTGRAHTL